MKLDYYFFSCWNIKTTTAEQWKNSGTSFVDFGEPNSAGDENDQ